LKENSQARDLWNDLHERIFDYDKLYLAGEHSAQQSRLKELEQQFNRGNKHSKLFNYNGNGVDIGGISAVVMSNAPPMYSKLPAKNW
jgi:hypothetical protein